MSRTIKEATVKRYFYEIHDQLCTQRRDHAQGTASEWNQLLAQFIGHAEIRWKHFL